MAVVTFQWLGLASFKIIAKAAIGEVSLLTDPFLPSVGIKIPRNVSADIVTTSDTGTRTTIQKLVSGEPFLIDHPGEYEVKGVFVYGTPAQHKETEEKKSKGPLQTLYRIEMADISIGHLGALTKPLTEEAMEAFTNIDVLCLPVGGKDAVLSASEAVRVLTRLEPRVVIPMYYGTSGLKMKLDPVETFIKESGLKPETGEKLKLAKKDLPQEDTKLFVFAK